ncbi:MAG TPA: ATP phosphoribosyltransferase [Proteobacteria bacterium]|nr:ATP phosphoribosyltransferase [bacterium BMS3Abin14]HDL52614.1 ATP phosphoribosyltransferase [Pseudomonadota bacterium]
MKNRGSNNNGHKVKIGLPKGSLEDATTELFRKAGWRISRGSRNYFPTVDDDELSFSLVRAQEMSRFVQDGILDAGITGRDWILENESDVVWLEELSYSKVSTRPARWVLIVPKNSSYDRIEDLAGKRISTELVGFTKRYFEEKKIDVKVDYSWGTTEAKVVEGIADAAVEVTETGSTIRAHGLKIIHELMQSRPCLIVNHGSYKDPFKRRKIENISLLLKGAEKAMGMVAIKLNVHRDNLEKVIQMMPSLNAPTVAGLHQSEWYSVESVVPDKMVRQLIPQLLECGAEGIIEYQLNKIL